ncbi:MAG: ribonucleotide-diphosphate reductase subunit beta, partial [Phenylobacterium sp.]
MNKPISNVRTLPGLLTPSAAYKPFRYPWAYEFWKKQQQVHWMP